VLLQWAQEYILLTVIWLESSFSYARSGEPLRLLLSFRRLRFSSGSWYGSDGAMSMTGLNIDISPETTGAKYALPASASVMEATLMLSSADTAPPG
jgi:hypothetical protein